MPEVMIVTSGVTKGPLVTILAKRFGIRSIYITNLETSLALVPASKLPFLTFVTMPARCQRNHDASRTKKVETVVAVSFH
jgi:hypothetical protein